MMVIFTTLVAFCAALYTARTTFVPPDALYAWPVAVGLAFIYAFGILIIDREIVGATSMKALWIRLVFAVPDRHRGFLSREAAVLRRSHRQPRSLEVLEEEHAPKLQRIAELTRTVESERQEQRPVRARPDRQPRPGYRASWMRRSRREKEHRATAGRSARPSSRPRSEMLERRLELVRQARFPQSAGPAPRAGTQREIEQLRMDMDNRAANAHDFLYKAEALDRIAAEMGR